MFGVFTLACVWGSLEEDSVGVAMLGILFGVFAGITLGFAVDENKKAITPTAIDVYRGKTTLQITYQDSLAIDSMVVFKNNPN